MRSPRGNSVAALCLILLLSGCGTAGSSTPALGEPAPTNIEASDAPTTTETKPPVRHDDVALEATFPDQVRDQAMFSGSSSFDNLLGENPDLAKHIADVADAVDVDPRSTTIAFARPQSEALWETFGGLQAERFPGASEVALTAKLLDKTTRPATVGDDVYDLGDGVYLRFVGDVVYYVFSHDPNWLEASVGVVPK